MERQKKIAIIGHFGGNEDITDGQTVKTKILYEELCAHTDWNIKKVDTYFKRTNPMKLFIETIIALTSTRDIIVLVSGNGMRFYFPLLWFFAKVLKTRVYHDVIGGNLDSYIKKHPDYVNYLNSFIVNWVETDQLKKKINRCGVNNCEVIPNFKRLNILPEEDIPKNDHIPMKFCTFSRVMKEKGIEEAIEAIELINADSNKAICTLDIYGLIDDDYRDRFDDVLSKVSKHIEYKGVVPFDKSVEAIKDYSALLFPTYWDGEGFPGTIVDAYSAGLPVIATEWNCNAELVEDGATGILYARDDGLKQAILRFMGTDTSDMRKKCIQEAKKYVPDQWIEIICKRIDNVGAT